MSDPLRNPLGAGVLDEDSHGAGQEVARLTVVVYASGAMRVDGPIEHKEWSVAALMNAIDAVKNHHARKSAGLVVPSKDVSILSL
jgi:hypothetical protein